MENTLLIDSSSSKRIKVGIMLDGKMYKMQQEIGSQKAQALLPMIDKLLKTKKLTITDINTIEVNAGPGSFTGIRVGLSIANALSYALKIPVTKIGLNDILKIEI